MRRLIASVTLLSGFLALSACSDVDLVNLEKSQPLETDTVKDVATAIRIGQQECLAARAIARAQKEHNWQARFHNRVWHVWEQEGFCEGFGSDLDSATGERIGGCSICVA